MCAFEQVYIYICNLLSSFQFCIYMVAQLSSLYWLSLAKFDAKWLTSVSTPNYFLLPSALLFSPSPSHLSILCISSSQNKCHLFYTPKWSYISILHFGDVTISLILDVKVRSFGFCFQFPSVSDAHYSIYLFVIIVPKLLKVFWIHYYTYK